MPARRRPGDNPLEGHDWWPTISTRAHPDGPVRVHLSHDRYRDHLERHLAKPEALEALRFVVPEVAAAPEFLTDRTLIRALRGGEGDASWRSVLDGYSTLARSTLDEAHALGWVVSPETDMTIAFATSGLIAVIDCGILRTLFFAALESAEARAHRLCLSAAELAAEQRREATWTKHERHFYRVFRPAVQLIRKMPDEVGAGMTAHYGSLKRVLPSAGALRLEGWMKARAATATWRDDHPGNPA